MEQLIPDILTNPQLYMFVAMWWVFNAGVDSMPAPGKGKGYKWLYQFLHALSGNIQKAINLKTGGK
tara:strand:+ start:558 stop:755 length:198 start_codon:yes stop_codon:yes gene_type:complete